MTPAANALSLFVLVLVITASRCRGHRICQVLMVPLTVATLAVAEPRWYPRVGIVILGLWGVVFIEFLVRRELRNDS